MGVLDNIVKGATTQFGREFGRAAANSVLKGSNHYIVKNVSEYDGRVKPSDSEIVKSIKEIKKVKFVNNDKGNATRLIEMNNHMLRHMKFNGVETLNTMGDIKKLIEVYNEKSELGNSRMSDDYQDELLESKQTQLTEVIKKFNNESTAFVKQKYDYYKSNLIKRKTTILLVLILGLFGGHKYYLRQYGWGIISTIIGFFLSLFIFTPIWFIPLGFWLIQISTVVFKSKEIFNQRYNPEYSYYKNFIN